MCLKSIFRTLFFVVAVSSFAFASIANFTALSGDVSIIESGKSSKATMDSKIDKSDKIVTGKDGKAQLKFTDSTVITLGVNSDFAIEEYLNDDNKPKVSFSIGKGTFKVLTGAMGKINPEGFKLKTKTATIGIRGTGILGQVTPQENKIACTQGAITVTSVDTGITVDVKAGEITSVAPNTPPAPPRAYSPQEINDIESDSGVGEMPDDTKAQGEVGTGATDTQGEATTEEETTAKEDVATDEAVANEGSEPSTTEDTTVATNEDDMDFGGEDIVTTAMSTDIETIDDIVISETTETDQSDNFMQVTTEALGISENELLNYIDEGSSGETYTYADDRDVELYGIFGGGVHDDAYPDLDHLGAYLTNTDNPSNSVFLKGYEFDIDIGVATPPVDKQFSFPRTPVADSYVWYKSALIAEYTGADASVLNTLFKSEIDNVTASTWEYGSEHALFDSKQEFFIYYADGQFIGTDSHYYEVEKIAVMGERAKWIDKPTAMYTYFDVFDDSLIRVNYLNNRMIFISPDYGDVAIGSVSDSGGYVALNGESYDGITGFGYIFGSEFQGYALQTSDSYINAGYEQPQIRLAPTYIYPSTNPTLYGRAISPLTDAGVAVSIDRTNAIIGVNIGGTLFGEDDSGQPSAYLDDANFATFNSSGDVFFTSGSDSYTTWGYWGTPSDTFSQSRGYWIAGEITDTSYVQNLIDTMPSGEYYTYSGSIEGSYYNVGDSSYVDKLGSSSSIDLKIFFSDGNIEANINMLEANNATNIYSSGGYELLSAGSVTNSDFSGNFDGTSGYLSGKYYGPNADKVAGSIRHTGGSYKARGIFNANKQ